MIELDGTFILAAISFLIFLFIIKAILFHPITKVIEERENYLAKNAKMEKESKEKSKALILDKEQKLKQARTEAGELIKEVSTAAKKAGSDAIKQTKHEVQQEIETNRKNLEESSINSKKELKSEIKDFVASIVSKILNEQVEITLEEDRINKYLKI